MSDPKLPRWANPVSSSTMASTLGAPAGGFGSWGKRGVDWAAVKPICCGGSGEVTRGARIMVSGHPRQGSVHSPLPALTGRRCSVGPRCRVTCRYPHSRTSPTASAPVIGYIATREPQPLEERAPVEREWWEMDDDEEWPSRQPRVIRVTAIVVSVSLLLAGIGTILGAVLAAH